MYNDLSELMKTYEDKELIQPLCELIKEKYFSRKSLLSSSFNFKNVNDRVFKFNSTAGFPWADCKSNENIEFSFSVLLEHLPERNPHFTAFVYYFTQLDDSVDLTFLACLPYWISLIPHKVKVQHEEP